MKKANKLTRADKNRIIGGVCEGMGDFFSIDPVILRVAFVIFTLIGGSGILLYVILWIVIPSANASDNYIKENVKEVKNKTKSVVGKNPKVLLGLTLVILGTIFLFNNLGILRFWNFFKLWPLIIIVIGVYYFLRDEK